jgi:hypothetical protein
MLWNTKKMKMLRRSLLLRILLEYSNNSPQHHGEVAAHRWGVMKSPWRAKSCMTEHIFTITGLIGCEGAQFLHRWARGSDSRGHGDSQARRQERDTMTHRSVRTEVLIFLSWESGSFYNFSATSLPRKQLRRR